LRKIGSKIPRGRVASAWEAAGSAVWLASRSAALVTGQTLVADGGWMLAAGTFVLDDGGRDDGVAGAAEQTGAGTAKRVASGDQPSMAVLRPKLARCWYD